MSHLPEYNNIEQQQALLLDDCSPLIKCEAATYNIYKQTQLQNQLTTQNQQGDAQAQELGRRRKNRMKWKKGRIIGNFINKHQDRQQAGNKKSALISRLKSIIIKRQPAFKQTYTKVELMSNIFALIDRNLKLKGDFKKYYPVKTPKQYSFFDKEQEIRHIQKNIVAESFCIIDHGHIPVLNYMYEKGVHVELSDSRYKSSIQAVVLEGYRQLQRFLFAECKIKIMAIPRGQIKKIRGVIFNCRLTFKEEEWLTFLNFIRLLYGFSDACIVKSIAIKLYASILTILKQRLKQFPTKQQRNKKGTRRGLSKDYFHPHSSQKLREIWNPQYEAELLEIYKEYQSFQSIKDHFHNVFPENKEYFTRLALQARFHHIIRVSLKRLRKIVEQKYEGRLRLVKWDDKIVKKMLAATPGIELRIKLIDVYCLRQMQFGRLVQLVNIVNEFVENKGEYYNTQRDRRTLNQQQQDFNKMVPLPSPLPSTQNTMSSGNNYPNQLRFEEQSFQIQSDLQNQLNEYIKYQNAVSSHAQFLQQTKKSSCLTISCNLFEKKVANQGCRNGKQ